MRNYKYPAPFDTQRRLDLGHFYLDLNVPLPTSPPLPVDIPTKQTRQRRGSLYRDLFGDDVSVLCLVLGDPQYSQDQRTLSTEILSGRKKLGELSAQDKELLDELVHGFDELDVRKNQKSEAPAPSGASRKP